MSDILKSASMVAMFGELLCDNQKEKNDWKKRNKKEGQTKKVNP